jgi:serine protease Do
MNRLSNPLGRRRAPVLAAALVTGTVLAGGASFWAWPSAAATTEPPSVGSTTGAMQAGFGALVKKVKPAVVNIATAEMSKQGDQSGQAPTIPPELKDTPFGQLFQQFSQQQPEHRVPEHALGSGFIVDPAGYIVTNNHVIDGATKIDVTLDDGSTHAAKLVGRDKKTDLALLKIDAGKSLPYVSFGNSENAQVGDWVIAVGDPFGLGGTVTAGIISAHNRDINSGPYDNFLQIDAPINPGNSGGPLFNQSGQVIGIDTAIYSPSGGSVGIGFAIPSNLASDIVTQLRDQGMVSRGWLGIEMQPLTEALAKAVGRPTDGGVLVDEVQSNSPASHALLKQGDVITAYNGTTIEKPRDLAVAVANTKAGDTATLTVWRDGRTQTLNVTIDRQRDEQTADNGGSDAQPSTGSVGMALQPLTSDARQQLGLDPSATGVVVAQIDPGSKADQSGLQSGDVIVRVGEDPVNSPAEVAAKVHEAEVASKQGLPLLVTRNGQTYYLALELAQG